MDPLLWLAAESAGKKHEAELDIVKMLLECLLLLCQRRGVREELRARKVYPIVRNLDYEQEDEGVSDLINEVVQFMIRDEDLSVPIDAPPAELIAGAKSSVSSSHSSSSSSSSNSYSSNSSSSSSSSSGNSGGTVFVGAVASAAASGVGDREGEGTDVDTVD